MMVEVEFSEDFEGVIYSQGYYNDPKCKYVFISMIPLNLFPNCCL